MSMRARRGLASWLVSSATPLFVLDERQVILVFNRGCEELTQWPAAELIGKSCHPRTTGDPDLATTLTSALCPPVGWTGESPVVIRTLLHRRDGSLLEQEIHFFSLAPAEGQTDRHLLGLLLPVQAAPPSVPSSRLELARHTALLFEKYGVDRLIACSPAMRCVLRQVELARPAMVGVHLTGEPGTGKEHLARLIHYTGPHRQQRFIPLRCGKSSSAELSRALHQAYDSLNSEGPVSIYLDQLPDLRPDLQALVLDHLEAPGFRHFSSSRLPLEQIGSDQLLPDLRMAQSSLVLHIPPLRQRPEDILPLAQQLLEEFNVPGASQHDGFTPTVERAFLQYQWPGNIDELSRVITHAARHVSRAVIDLEDLPFDFNAGCAAKNLRPAAPRRGLEDLLQARERELIQQALQDARGNKSVAADLLQIPRPKLYRRLAALGWAMDEADDPQSDSLHDEA